MLRSSVGWCAAILLVAAGVNACGNSSSDEATGKGGTGTVIGGSGGSGGTDSTAGTRTNGGTAGTTTGACTDLTPPTCVDDKTLSACDTTTGMMSTLNCVTDSASVGLVASGCKVGTSGAYCAVTDFSDADCKAGKDVAQYCDPTVTDSDAISIYIACYKDTNGSRASITCLSKYVTPNKSTTADCNKAIDTCLGTGAGGEGAGGAAPEPTGGAGGAGGAG